MRKSTYAESFSRNLGVVTETEQMQLRNCKIAVLGLGGIGGPCFEALVRTGIGAFNIVDHDRFEPSNKNRQIHAKESTIGLRKTDVAKTSALEINADVTIQKFDTVDETNVSSIIEGCQAVVHAIDRLKPCLISARYARQTHVPVIEGWALPYANVRVLTHQTPSMEEVYHLPTQGRPIADITDEEFKRCDRIILDHLAKIEGVLDHYDGDLEARIKAGQTPSFGPMAWCTAVFMAIEVVKICLKRGRIATGPFFTLYDPFEHRVRVSPEN